MNNYKQNDNILSSKINDISIKISTIHNCLELICYCLEQNVWKDYPIEITSLAELVCEYSKNTVQVFNDFQDEIGIF